MIQGEQFAIEYTTGLEITQRFLLAQGFGRDLSADLAQGAWVRAWERRAQWRGEASFVTWVNTIAWNEGRRWVGRAVNQFLPLEGQERHAQGEGPAGVVEARVDLDRILGRMAAGEWRERPGWGAPGVRDVEVLRERFLQEREYGEMRTGGVRPRQAVRRALIRAALVA